MTKQEEIDWGLRTLLGDLFGEDEDNYLYIASKKVREYLRSQDVMIKVKCPDCAWSQFKDEVAGMTPCYSCDSTGYIVEPLIKEE